MDTKDDEKRKNELFEKEAVKTEEERILCLMEKTNQDSLEGVEDAYKALGQFDRPLARNFLIQKAKDGNVCAIEALGNFNNKSAVKALIWIVSQYHKGLGWDRGMPTDTNYIEILIAIQALNKISEIGTQHTKEAFPRVQCVLTLTDMDNLKKEAKSFIENHRQINELEELTSIAAKKMEGEVFRGKLQHRKVVNTFLTAAAKSLTTH